MSRLTILAYQHHLPTRFLYIERWTTQGRSVAWYAVDERRPATGDNYVKLARKRFRSAKAAIAQIDTWAQNILLLEAKP